MDKRQKSTLRSLHIKIADELILDEDFYAALRRDKIFTNGMLDIIKAQETPRNRVYKMLELLEKRGPEAFNDFVWILKENFQWLAKELEEQHNRKLQRSQQGRERNEQSHQTQLKHFSNDQYHRYNPKVSNHEAVFTPDPQQRASRHNIPSQEKQYKDACTSPIGIIESPRKNVIAMSSPIHQQSDTKEETQSETDSYDQGFGESPSQTATVATSTNDDVESQITSTSQVQSKDFEKVSENIDAVDAPNHDDLDETDDDFQTSEAYYDCVRGESSRLSHLTDDMFHQEFKIQDNENNATGSEISYEQSEAFKNQIEEMRELYNKLNATKSENDDSEDLKDEIVTWERIHIETNILISKLESSDDTKMIKKCYELFPEKDRQLSLNVCIERLFANKEDLESRLGEQKKEANTLLHDLWKHEGGIIKLKKALADKEADHDNLKTSLDNLEKDAAINHKQMEEKDAKIKELESRVFKLETDQQKRSAAALRNSMANRRQVSNSQGQSPRRRSRNTEPRISQMLGAYSQQSPRNMTTYTRGAPGNKK